MSDRLLVRPATISDADALVELGRAVAGEDGLWLTYDRSRTDERRTVKSVRRDPNVAIFVAETPDGVVGRLSIARDHSPYSRHVAELGLMVAAGVRRTGGRNGSHGGSDQVGARSGDHQARAPPFSLITSRPLRSTGSWASVRRASCAGGTRLHGRFVDAMLMGLDLD